MKCLSLDGAMAPSPSFPLHTEHQGDKVSFPVKKMFLVEALGKHGYIMWRGSLTSHCSARLVDTI